MQTLKLKHSRTTTELSEYLTDKRKVYSLDLLSGYSCPFAESCLSKAVVQPNGKRKIQDGHKTQFRCFSASQEVQYTNVYNLRKHNFDLLICKLSPVRWSNLSMTHYPPMLVLFASTLQAISLIRNISERGA